jgi:hypothetical protein
METVFPRFFRVLNSPARPHFLHVFGTTENGTQALKAFIMSRDSDIP